MTCCYRDRSSRSEPLFELLPFTILDALANNDTFVLERICDGVDVYPAEYAHAG
jgi:hypothetical protein